MDEMRQGVLIIKERMKGMKLVDNIIEIGMKNGIDRDRSLSLSLFLSMDRCIKVIVYLKCYQMIDYN
jgi:hypothetical protein